MEFGANNEEGSEDINTVWAKLERKVEKSDRPLCYACGRPGHFRRDRRCPARGEKCLRCGRYGHFQAQCRSSIGTSSNTMTESNKRSNLNCLEEKCVSRRAMKQPDANFVPGYDIFTVNSPVKSVCSVEVDIGNVTVPNVIIDSGAVTNVISKNTWD